MSRKGEHWTLNNNILMFGQPFGICTKNIMASGSRTSNAGSGLTGSVRNLINDMQISQNESFCNRYCWRFARSWKGRVNMDDRVRAEPGHRLDKFTQWSREVIANNKCVDRDGSPPQHANLTSEKALKGGENNAEK